MARPFYLVIEREREDTCVSLLDLVIIRVVLWLHSAMYIDIGLDKFVLA